MTSPYCILPEKIMRCSSKRPPSWTWPLACLLVLVILTAPILHAAPPAIGSGIKFRTLGGTQFWSDQLIFRGWRIQRNAVTHHYRLLDSKNYRHTWGSLEHCEKTLAQLKTQLKLLPIKGKVVIVLHGLGRTRNSMHGISEYLGKHSDYTVLRMSYASTRAPVADHAKSLQQVIRGLPQATEISFVAHSLGNLVIRHYLADVRKKKISHPPWGSIIMLAPPNQGSSMAQQISNNKAVRVVWGPSGNEIGSHWTRLSSQLATPQCRFGIIAGKSERTVLNNPLINGHDDLVVTVEETRLAGAHDFLVAPAIHTYLMDHPQVQVATLRFLHHGYFESEVLRKPIKAVPGKP